MPPACVLEERGTATLCVGCTGFPAKQGFPKGTPLWHTALLAKCSVLYLLSRLAGKMRVSPDGNAHFARQENGQVFADGDEQKPGRFREWQQGYCSHYTPTWLIQSLIFVPIRSMSRLPNSPLCIMTFRERSKVEKICLAHSIETI